MDWKTVLGLLLKIWQDFSSKSRSASAISFAAAGREDHGSRVFFLKWDFSHNNNQIQKLLLWPSFDISSKCSVCWKFQKKKNHHLNSTSLLYMIMICLWRQPGSVGTFQGLHRGFLLLHLCPLSGGCSKYQHMIIIPYKLTSYHHPCCAHTYKNLIFDLIQSQILLHIISWLS